MTNRNTLLGNAATYAKRAVQASGSSFASSNAIAGTVKVGWEKERMGREAVLMGWRVGFWRGEFEKGREAVEEVVKKEGVGRKGLKRGDVVRFLEEVGEEEGGLEGEEREFWEGVVGVLG